MSIWRGGREGRGGRVGHTIMKLQLVHQRYVTEVPATIKACGFKMCKFKFGIFFALTKPIFVYYIIIFKTNCGNKDERRVVRRIPL